MMKRVRPANSEKLAEPAVLCISRRERFFWRIFSFRTTPHSINTRKLAKPAALGISLLFIISILSIFAATAVQCSTSASPIFGNTTVGSNAAHNDANAQSVSYFTCTTAGSVTDIVAYVDGQSAGAAIAALYAVSGGSAGTLLRQSGAVSVGTSFSWVDFQLPSSVSVASGTTYGLALMGSVPLNLMEVGGTGQRDHNAVSSYSSGFANPFGTVWGTDKIGAMSIYAASTAAAAGQTLPTPTSTLTPTPTPTTTPTLTPTATPNENSLIAINDGNWYTDSEWLKCPALNVALDTTNTYGGSPSWKITLSSVNYGADFGGLSIAPGDTIVYSCWIKTSAATLSSDIGNPQAGGRIGIDFYGANGGITGIETPNGVTGCSNSLNTYVKFGTSTWTEVTMSFTIPWTYTATGAYGGSYRAGQSVTPTSIIPWLEVWSDTQGSAEHGTAWFADAQLTITP